MMKIHSIINLLIVCPFLKDVRLWELESKSPVIYPEKFNLVVDAHFDLTLGCRGSELLNWTFHDEHNKPRNKLFTIFHSINVGDPDYKFEAILKVNQMKYTDVGLYYCHGQEVPYNTPQRSNSIYIYVKDDNVLSVLPTGNEYIISSYKYIPCRRTSPDVNIELRYWDGTVSTVNAINYTYYKLPPHQYENTENDIIFHPNYGFIISDDTYLTECSCRFTRGNTSFEIQFNNFTYIPIAYAQILNLDGPDEVNLSDNVTLTCAIFIPFYFYRRKSDFYWQHNEKYINDTSTTIKNELISLKGKLLIRSYLTITNVSIRHSGLYSCNRKGLYGHFVGNQKFLKVYGGYFSDSTRIITVQITASCIDQLGTFFRQQAENFFDNKTKMYESNFSTGVIQYQRIFCCDYNLQQCDSRYVYIRDQDDRNVVLPYEYIYIPCTSTSNKWNVSLKINMNNKELVPLTEQYEEWKGFLVQMPYFSPVDTYKVSCLFGDPIDKIANFQYFFISVDIRSPPSIIGPRLSLIPINEKLELLCKLLVYNNVTEDMLQWETPHRSKYEKLIEKSSLNTSEYKVIVSKLIMHNVGRDHEGRYKCYIPNSDLVAEEYISVIDPFNIEPVLEIVDYNFAYIGQKMHLRCSVNISHNVAYNISWNIQNEIQTTNDQVIINMGYINEIRYVYATSILQINNVTHGHSGNYTCIVNDYLNRNRYATKEVLPRIGKRAKIRACNFNNHSIIEAELYSELILNCSVDGDPEPKIIWNQNSSDLKFSRGIVLSADNTELTIILVLNFTEGLYTCTARNLFGKDHSEVTVVLLEPLDLLNNTSLTCIGLSIILLATLSILLSRRIYRHKKLEKKLLTSGFLNIDLLDYDTKWEIPREKIILGKMLGSGYFGYVMKSSLLDFFEDDPNKTVAVKMLHPNCGLLEINSLISEMQVLVQIRNHINLIKFLGACTQDVQKKQLLIIMEYCEHGNLGDYLIAKRDNFINLLNSDGSFISSFAEITVSFNGDRDAERVSTLELLCWSLQVAQGMQFLATRKVVHGDLAARNVLLSQNNIVKISDFGLAKNLGTKSYYKKKSQCPLPIKWMAIESIRDKTFSTKSDVWSYGVFLWELFSLARTPYPDLQMDFSFYHKILGGYRLECPAYSPLEIYKLMSECWQYNPERRPTFQGLTDNVATFLPIQVRQVYMLDHHYQNISVAEIHSHPNNQQDDSVEESVSLVIEDSSTTEWIPMQQFTTQAEVPC